MPDTSAAGWVILLVSYLVAGLLILVGSLVSASASVNFFAEISGRVRISLVGWGFLVIGLVGLLVEVASRFVAIPLVRVLPAGLYSVITLGIAAEPEAPAGSVPPAVPAGPAQPPAAPAAPQQQPEPTQWIVISDDQVAAAGPVVGDADRSDTTGMAPAGAPLQAGTRTLSRKAKRGWIIAGIVTGVVVIGLIGSSVVINTLGKGTYGPQHKVEAYLQALVDGDADKAVKLLDPNVTDDQRVLLSNDVYEKAKNRPTAYRIVSTDISDDGATVEARITQSGKTYPVTFGLSKEGKQAVFFDDWRLESGLQPARVLYYQGTDELTVNGVTVKAKPLNSADDPDVAMDVGSDQELATMLQDHGLPILPGSYEFAAPAGTKYVSYGEDITVDATPDGFSDQSQSLIAFRQGYTKAVVTDASRQIMDRIGSCVADEVIRIPDCEAASWEDTSWKAIRKIERSWSSNPTVAVISADQDDVYDTESSDVSQLTGQLAAVINDGDIDVSYQVRDSEDEDWFDLTDTYSPFEVDYEQTRFPITIDGDKLSVDLSALDKYNPDWLLPEHR